MARGRAIRAPLQRAIVAALVFAIACTQRPEEPVAVLRPANGGPPVTVTLEVAADAATRERGLMWRTKLAEGQGMLFVFPEDADRAFWMKNTLIPLDIVFIARDGPAEGRIVGIRANTTPLSTAPLGVGVPSRWVLEVPAGFMARHRLAAGDRVELRGVPAP